MARRSNGAYSLTLNGEHYERRTQPPTTDYKVADLSVAAWDYQKINIAETEMPGWWRFAEIKTPHPLTGARALPARCT